MIYISTASRRGSSHPDRNEDNLYHRHADKFITGGVFDGCSSGIDSFFASKLYANIYKKTASELDKVVTGINGFQILVRLYFSNLARAIHEIGLATEETLSTAVLFMYETETAQLQVRFFGDGVAYANNNILEVFNNDEDNQPNYIGYTLNETGKANDFDNCWEAAKSFNTITRDFSIATDGIFSFRKTKENAPDFPIEKYLVQDDFLKSNPASLKRKLNLIRNKGYEHYDDVTLIRVIQE